MLISDVRGPTIVLYNGGDEHGERPLHGQIAPQPIRRDSVRAYLRERHTVILKNEHALWPAELHLFMHDQRMGCGAGDLASREWATRAARCGGFVIDEVHPASLHISAIEGGKESHWEAEAINPVISESLSSFSRAIQIDAAHTRLGEPGAQLPRIADRQSRAGRQGVPRFLAITCGLVSIDLASPVVTLVWIRHADIVQNAERAVAGVAGGADNPVGALPVPNPSSRRNDEKVARVFDANFDPFWQSLQSRNDFLPAA